MDVMLCECELLPVRKRIRATLEAFTDVSSRLLSPYRARYELWSHVMIVATSCLGVALNLVFKQSTTLFPQRPCCSFPLRM